MLADEYKFFLDNKSELEKLYADKILVIKDKKVVGVYDDEMDAYLDSLEKYEPGTYLIQKCEIGDEGLTLTFHSRVSFA